MLDVIISRTERRAFYFTIVVLFGLRFVEIIAWWFVPRPTVTEDGVRISYGTVPSWTMDLLSPIFCFVVFLFVVSTLWSLSLRNLTISAFFIFFLALFFDYWFIESQLRLRQIL